jgi:DNA-binding NarL/FixJ family response regulator
VGSVEVEMQKLWRLPLRDRAIAAEAVIEVRSKRGHGLDEPARKIAAQIVGERHHLRRAWPASPLHQCTKQPRAREDRKHHDFWRSRPVARNPQEKTAFLEKMTTAREDFTMPWRHGSRSERRPMRLQFDPMGAKRAGSAQMVAAAYDLNENLAAWFESAVSLFRPHLDDGFGVFGVVFDKKPPSFVHVHLDGAHPINQTLMHLSGSLGLFSRAPEDFQAKSCSDLLGLATTRGLVRPFRSLLAATDCSGVWGHDGAGLSLLFTAPVAELGRASAYQQRLAKTVLPHFAAALRLRRTLTGLSFETESAEAIFDPEGRCLNAQGFAEPATARETLRSAVIEQETQRTRAIDDGDPPRDALLAGRWSLVDRFDRHGRRFIVAYRNPPGVLDPRRLSPREREVAARIARGTSQAAIARELGVRPSTVASIAAGIVDKLGLRSTRELPLFWRDTAGYAVALGRSDVVALYCSEAAPWAPELTRAEREVLSGVIRGKSNREIAVYRDTSTRTVANQVASLFKKFGVASRTELSARGLDAAE